MIKLKQQQADKYTFDIYFGNSIIGTVCKRAVATLEIQEMERPISFDLKNIDKMPVKDFPENFFFMTQTQTCYAGLFYRVSLFRQKNEFSIEFFCSMYHENTPMEKNSLWNIDLLAALMDKIAVKKKAAAETVKYKSLSEQNYMQFTFFFNTQDGDTVGKHLQQAVAYIEQIYAEASDSLLQKALAESKKRVSDSSGQWVVSSKGRN